MSSMGIAVKITSHAVDLALVAAGSTGTPPVPVRRAISARTAPSHLISSSSLGAQRSSVFLVVMILNVCFFWASSVSSVLIAPLDVDVGTGAVGCVVACREGSSYSSASTISENWNLPCGFVSCGWGAQLR